MGEKKSVGVEDEAFSTATKTNSSDFAGQRKQNVEDLEVLFDSKVAMTCVPDGMYNQQGIMQAIRGGQSKLCIL